MREGYLMRSTMRAYGFAGEGGGRDLIIPKEKSPQAVGLREQSQTMLSLCIEGNS